MQVSKPLPKPPVPGVPKAAAQEEGGIVKSEEVAARSNSEVVVKPQKAGIKVVALQDGIFQNRRIKEGMSFFIAREQQLGRWMKCVDPKMQERHLANMKAKKAGK